MSKPATLLFTLSLRQLASDGKKAGANLPNAQLHYISVKQLETLLQSMARLAPSVAYPAEPEMRISRGGRGDFVVRIKTGQLHLVSWSSAHKGGVVTPEQIVAAVAGEDGGEEAQPAGAAAGGATRSWRERLTLVGLAAAVVAVNAFTVWFLTRPPRGFVAKYRLLEPERAQRVLADVAGAYQTGKGPGDRRLEIKPPGSAQRIKYGNEGIVKDQQNFDVKPVDAAGTLALLTSRKSLIKIKDNTSVVLFGDTYTRVTN